jgi:hypothetical protein
MYVMRAVALHAVIVMDLVRSHVGPVREQDKKGRRDKFLKLFYAIRAEAPVILLVAIITTSATFATAPGGSKRLEARNILSLAGHVAQLDS